jgi:hypothetical protein
MQGTEEGQKEMNITIKVTKEHKDGSADAQVNFDKEALEYMVEYAVVGMLKEYCDKKDKEWNPDAKAKPTRKTSTKKVHRGT